jgi:hypothetical protein
VKGESREMDDQLTPHKSIPGRGPQRRSPWPWLLAAGCVLLLLVALLRPSRPGDGISPGGENRATSTSQTGQVELARKLPRNARSAPAATAEEVVARKLSQFARSRRDYMYALARRHNVEVLGDVERFFDAVESGNWEAIEAAFKKINGGDGSAGHNKDRPPEVTRLWPAIIDAYGAAEQVNKWPAQKLLDYGSEILGSLRPGMVYVGGTDNGRWIPELLNETSDGERHVIVTQNGLADGSYLDYLRLQYDDRLKTLSNEDSQRAFQEYLSDAEKRLEHDRQFPDEPKQVRPGEDIQMVDNRVEVGGTVAVMAINEKLLEMLMQKNPELSFALQESFPLRGTYEDALPLGPLMELGARDEQSTFTASHAAQYLDYWRDAAQRVLFDPEGAGSETALKSYSHDTVSAANLLAAHNFNTEAEQAYRLATQLWPENPESAGGLAGLLAASGRQSEAQRILDDFNRQYPGRQKDLERVSSTFKLIVEVRK